MISFINYYKSEKEIYFRKNEELYFIPNEYNVGKYKLKDIKYLKYNNDDFEKLSQKEQEKILAKYMIWIKYENIIYNGFNEIFVSSIDDLEISYIKVNDKQKGILEEIKNPNNNDQFFRYINIEKNDEINNIIDECSNILYEEVKKIFENNKFKNKIHKIFFDYYGDGENIDIGITIVTFKDMLRLIKKYNYIYYMIGRIKEIKKYGKSFNYDSSYKLYIKSVLENSGDYKSCRFGIENLDRISSYYCSLFEQNIVLMHNGEYDDNYLLVEVCKKVINQLKKDINKYNMSENCKFKIEIID